MSSDLFDAKRLSCARIRRVFAGAVAFVVTAGISTSAFAAAGAAFPIPTAAPSALPQRAGRATPRTSHGTIYVMSDRAKAVYAFPDDADGDVAPVVLSGSRTQLTGHAASIATDERGQLYVLDDVLAADGRTFASQHVLVFQPNAAGDTAPARVLRLPNGFRAQQLSVRSGVVYLSTFAGAKPVHAFSIGHDGTLTEIASLGAAGSSFLSRLAFDGGRAFGSDYTRGIVAFSRGPSGHLTEAAIPVPRTDPSGHIDGVAAGGGLVDALSYGGLQHDSFIAQFPAGAGGRSRPVRTVFLGGGSVHTPVPVAIAADSRGALYVVAEAWPDGPEEGAVEIVEPGSATITRLITGSHIRWAGPVDIAHADSRR